MQQLYVVNLFKGRMLVRPTWRMAHNWANWAIGRSLTNGGIVTPNGKLNGRKGFTQSAMVCAMANRANSRYGNRIGVCQYAHCHKVITLLIGKGYLVAK